MGNYINEALLNASPYKKQQEEAQALAKAQAEEAEKPENQLASGYMSYLTTKACYEARQG